LADDLYQPRGTRGVARWLRRECRLPFTAARLATL